MANKKKRQENRAGKKKKLIIIISAAILAAVAAVAVILILTSKNAAKEDMNTGLDGIDIYYGEPIGALLARLGEPESVSGKDPYSGETTYRYIVDAFGVKDSILQIYGKEAEHYDNQVYSVTLTMPADDREALFYRVREHISEKYKNRKGYAVSDISEFNGLTFCSVYTESDDYTESCGINYDSEAVELTAIYSPKY